MASMAQGSRVFSSFGRQINSRRTDPGSACPETDGPVELLNAGNGWEWGNGTIIHDYYGSFPHSLLSTHWTGQTPVVRKDLPNLPNLNFLKTSGILLKSLDHHRYWGKKLALKFPLASLASFIVFDGRHDDPQAGKKMSVGIVSPGH